MFESEQSLWMVISIIIALAFYLQRFKVFAIFGPPILCIFMGTLLANLGVVPHWSDTYGSIIGYAIPLALGMYLININIKEVLSLSKQPIVALLLAMFSVSLMALIGAFIFHDSIPDAWKYTGMFIGTYTGGSANLTAVGTAVNATADQLAAANAADYSISMPILVLLFALPRIILKSKWCQKMLPHQMTEEELHSNDEPELFTPKEWSVVDLAMLIGLGFFLITVGTYMGTFVSEEFSNAVKIITITTLAVILGQFKSIQSIKGNTEVGIYISSFFLVVIGFLIDIEKFLDSIPQIAMYCALILLGSAVVYYWLCRLFKIKYQYMIIAYVAAIAEGTTSAIIAASNKWKSLVPIAILLGASGLALGNYLGIFIAYFARSLGF